MAIKGKIYIVTDGASRGNPGPAGIGYAIYDDQWNLIEEYTEYIGDATNNKAEYEALLKALDCATGHCRDEIIHYSDSQLVVKQMNGDFGIKALHLKKLADKVVVKKQHFKKVKHRHLPRNHPRIQYIDQKVNDELNSHGF